MVSCSTATNITVSRWKLRCECHSENEFCMRQEPCQRNRKLLELHEEATRQVQRLQFCRFRVTFERVRARNGVSSGGVQP